MIIDRLSKVEELGRGSNKKIDEIHKTLVGNGRPGLVAEWNQWKGGMKLFSWIIGSVVTLLSLWVSVITFLT